VKVKSGKELLELADGLKNFLKPDPMGVRTTEDSGEHVIAGCGELYVGICLKSLCDEYA